MKLRRDFFIKLSAIGMVLAFAVMIAGILPSKTCHAADRMMFTGMSKCYTFWKRPEEIEFRLRDGEKVMFLISRLRELVFYSNKFSPGFRLSLVLCQDLKQIKMRIFHRKINICSLSCIYTII